MKTYNQLIKLINEVVLWEGLELETWPVGTNYIAENGKSSLRARIESSIWEFF